MTKLVTVSDRNADIPERWALAHLGDVVQPSKEKIDPQRVPDLPYLSLEHIEAHSRRIVGHAVAREATSTKAVFRPGDVLYGKLRPYLNKVCRPDFEGVCSTDILVFSQRPELDSRYLLYFLNRQEVVDATTHAMAGVNLPRVSFGTLAELEFPLPPLVEQRRIADRLDALLRAATVVRDRLAKLVKDRKEGEREIPSILKRFRQSVLAAACAGQLTAEWRELDNIEQPSENKELPALWEKHTLRDLCEGFEYGSSLKSDDMGDVPVLRMGNLQDGKIDWTDLKYSCNKSEIAKYSLAPNTILFNRTNSPELVGKTAIYRGERPAIFAGYLIRILHGSRLDPEFLNYCLNEQDFREYCMQVKSDGVSQSNINAKKLSNYEMAVPPLDEQREIVRRVEALFALADGIEAHVRAATVRAERLPQAILARAFRGELVPTEAELARTEDRAFESGQKLLDRIKQSPKPPSRRIPRKRSAATGQR